MSPRQDYLLRELATTLEYELELQGVPGSLHLGPFPEDRTDPVYALLDPQGYVALEGDLALNDALLRRTVFICTGPAPGANDREQLRLLSRAGSVFALDPHTVAVLHRAKIRARLLRPGYSKALDHYTPKAPRPLDVLFLGAASPRRAHYLAAAAEVLSRHECALEMVDHAPTALDGDSPLGEARWSQLTQAKIVINLHRDEDTRLEWRETLDAIHAGAVVVSEHSSGLSPLIPGEHLFVASPDSLAYVVEALLADQQRLEGVRAQAYDRLRGWLPFALWVSVLRAAIVELVGEPVPAR